jgi:hypothetical protein
LNHRAGRTTQTGPSISFSRPHRGKKSKQSLILQKLNGTSTCALVACSKYAHKMSLAMALFLSCNGEISTPISVSVSPELGGGRWLQWLQETIVIVLYFSLFLGFYYLQIENKFIPVYLLLLLNLIFVL